MAGSVDEKLLRGDIKGRGILAKGSSRVQIPKVGMRSLTQY